MPRKIQFSNGNKAEYFYDATGVKYKAQWGYAATPQNIPLGATGTEYQSPTGVSRTEYCGNYVYENGNLRRIVTPEGYVATNNNVTEVMIRNTWRHRYLLKDHLGNTRRTLNANALNSTSPTVIPSGQLIDYYPFGLEITRVTNPEGEDYSPSYLAGATIPYLYNGKEIDRMHGLNWYDYGARFYDPALGRWHGVDPLAEAMPYASSFNYCLNNPVNHIDPDGKIPVWPILGAAMDYGFQVKDNYSNGKSGYDAWVGDVNFVSVGLSSLNPSGKFKVLKVLAVEVIKAAAEYTTLNEGVQINSNLKDVAIKATVNTLIDVGAGKLTDAGSKKAVQNANSEVSAANQKLKTAERQAKRSPNSTKKSENVNKSQTNVQLTRNKQVRTQVLNSTVGKAPEATQQIIDTSTDRIIDNDKRK